MPNMKEEQRRSFWGKQAPATIAGVVLLGLIGSTLYDLLVKPGLTGFGRLALDTLTLGSKYLQDSSYASAALDPNPVTGLLLLQGAILAASIPALTILGAQLSRRDHLRILQLRRESRTLEATPALEKEEARLTQKVRRLKVAFWLLFLPWIAMAIVSFSMHNQSVLVWRVFNANLAILSSVSSAQELSDLRGKFAQMKSREDYINLVGQMNQIATLRHVQLHSIETW